MIDHDYLNKLNPEELRWLSNFNEEYISGNFKHGGKILHRTKKERKKCYDRNNSRNRDTLTIAKATGHIQEGEKGMKEAQRESDIPANPEHTENVMLDFIDLKPRMLRRLKKMEQPLRRLKKTNKSR